MNLSPQLLKRLKNSDRLSKNLSQKQEQTHWQIEELFHQLSSITKKQQVSSFQIYQNNSLIQIVGTQEL